MDGVDLSTDLALAARRAEAKRRLEALLADLDLSHADRRAILLDLAVADGGQDARKRPAEDGPRRGAVGAPAVRGRPTRPMRPSDDNGHGRTDALLAILAANPGVSIGDMSKAVYGDAEEASRNKTRSLLNALKKRGRVNNLAPGKWEVVK